MAERPKNEPQTDSVPSKPLIAVEADRRFPPSTKSLVSRNAESPKSRLTENPYNSYTQSNLRASTNVIKLHSIYSTGKTRSGTSTLSRSFDQRPLEKSLSRSELRMKKTSADAEAKLLQNRISLLHAEE
jgi:hypothetical protein